VYQPRTAIACFAGYREALPPDAFHAHAKALHQVQGNLDVGLGDQFARHLDLRLPARQRQGHQQGGEELRGNIAAHADRRFEPEIAGTDFQRRETVVAEIADVGAKTAQGIDQIADRPLVHARHPGERVMPSRQRQRRRQRPEGRAGIAQEEVTFLVRKRATDTSDAPDIATERFHADTELAQRGQHHAGVVRIEQIAKFRDAIGQSSQQQTTIGNAFRSRQPDGAGSPAGRRQVKMVHARTFLSDAVRIGAHRSRVTVGNRGLSIYPPTSRSAHTSTADWASSSCGVIEQLPFFFCPIRHCP